MYIQESKTMRVENTVYHIVKKQSIFFYAYEFPLIFK